MSRDKADELNAIRVEFNPISGADQVYIGSMRTAPMYVYVNCGGSMRVLAKFETDGTVRVDGGAMKKGALVHVKQRNGKTRIVKTEPDHDLFSQSGMTDGGLITEEIAKDLNRKRAAARTAAAGGPPALTGADDIPLEADS